MEVQDGIWAVVKFIAEQSPELALIGVVAIRLERQLSSCIEHMERLIDRLIDKLD